MSPQCSARPDPTGSYETKAAAQAAAFLLAFLPIYGACDRDGLAAQPMTPAASIWEFGDEFSFGFYRRRVGLMPAPRGERDLPALSRHQFSVSHLHHQHHRLDRHGPDRGLSRLQG